MPWPFPRLSPIRPRSRKAAYLAAAALLCVAAAGFFRMVAPAGTAPPSGYALAAGECRFSRSDLSLAAALARLSNPGENDPEAVAAYRLIEGCAYADYLSRLWRPVSREDLSEEARRRERSTYAPESLARVRALFPDEGSYLRIGVLPEFANSRYHFSVFPELQRSGPAAAEASSALAGLLAGGTLPEGKAAVRSVFEPERGFLPEDGADPPAERNPQDFGVGDAARVGRDAVGRFETSALGEFRKYEDEVFSTLAPGEWFGKVVEREGDFALVRWVSETASWRVVETVSFPKPDPFEAFERHKREVRVSIPDPALRTRVLGRSPGASAYSWE